MALSGSMLAKHAAGPALGDTEPVANQVNALPATRGA